ncbi:hypothetical protein DMUE_4416 [Dictyocoela muelleri]|nr:hypothetical protein DMUE_4416 [Dictyocoela muelleri]
MHKQEEAFHHTLTQYITRTKKILSSKPNSQHTTTEDNNKKETYEHAKDTHKHIYDTTSENEQNTLCSIKEHEINLQPTKSSKDKYTYGVAMKNNKLLDNRKTLYSLIYHYPNIASLSTLNPKYFSTSLGLKILSYSKFNLSFFYKKRNLFYLVDSLRFTRNSIPILTKLVSNLNILYMLYEMNAFKLLNCIECEESAIFFESIFENLCVKPELIKFYDNQNNIESNKLNDNNKEYDQMNKYNTENDKLNSNFEKYHFHYDEKGVENLDNFKKSTTSEDLNSVNPTLKHKINNLDLNSMNFNTFKYYFTQSMKEQSIINNYNEKIPDNSNKNTLNNTTYKDFKKNTTFKDFKDNTTFKDFNNNTLSSDLTIDNSRNIIADSSTLVNSINLNSSQQRSINIFEDIKSERGYTVPYEIIRNKFEKQILFKEKPIVVQKKRTFPFKEPLDIHKKIIKDFDNYDSFQVKFGMINTSILKMSIRMTDIYFNSANFEDKELTYREFKFLTYLSLYNYVNDIKDNITYNIKISIESIELLYIYKLKGILNLKRYDEIFDILSFECDGCEMVSIKYGVEIPCIHTMCIKILKDYPSIYKPSLLILFRSVYEKIADSDCKEYLENYFKEFLDKLQNKYNFGRFLFGGKF